MNLSRVKPAILSSKRVLVVKPRTVAGELIWFLPLCLSTEVYSGSSLENGQILHCGINNWLVWCIAAENIWVHCIITVQVRSDIDLAYYLSTNSFSSVFYQKLPGLPDYLVMLRDINNLGLVINIIMLLQQQLAATSHGTWNRLQSSQYYPLNGKYFSLFCFLIVFLLLGFQFRSAVKKVFGSGEKCVEVNHVFVMRNNVNRSIA